MVGGGVGRVAGVVGGVTATGMVVGLAASLPPPAASATPPASAAPPPIRSGSVFESDRERKRRDANESMRRSADKWARAPYEVLRRLERW